MHTDATQLQCTWSRWGSCVHTDPNTDPASCWTERVKYHNKPTEVDGYRFDSKAEAKRYGELKLLERTGKLRHLSIHPKYPLMVNEKLVCTYVADFSYLLEGRSVIEDVKGVKTAAYRIKKKLFEILHPGMVIEEVKVR